MSEHTQTLDPKEQNRMHFIRTDRKQDHGTRGTERSHAEHIDTGNELRRKAFLDRKFGEEAIRDALAAATSPAELESHANQLLLEAGDVDLVRDVETFQIPVEYDSGEDGDVKVHRIEDHPQGKSGAEFEEEFKAQLNRRGRNAYARREDDEDIDFSDGFSVRDRP